VSVILSAWTVSFASKQDVCVGSAVALAVHASNTEQATARIARILRWSGAPVNEQ
jgi:hypothetical protein